MIAANGDMATDATLPNATAAPFSYAQAAKGKPSSPPAKQQSKSPSPLDRAESPSNQGLDPSSRRSDSAEEADSAANGKHHDVNGDNTNTYSPSGELKSGNASYAGSTLVDSRSSSQPKESIQPSGHAKPADLPWRQRPQDADSFNESSSDTASHKDDRKRERPELVAAPVPAVNIWAQRAQDAKSKVLPPPTAPAKAQQSDTHSAPKPLDGAMPASSQTNHNEGQRVKPEESRERRSLHEDRPSRSQPNGPSNGRSRAPVVNDSQSWPTPETAKDDERRRSHSKPDATLSPVYTKPHTKNDKWVSMPFTPSVKFETPLPTGARRGGRVNGRGGRDAGGRGGLPPTGARAPSAGPTAPMTDDLQTSAETRVEKPNKATLTNGKARKAAEDPATSAVKPPGLTMKLVKEDRRSSEPVQSTAQIDTNATADVASQPASPKLDSIYASQSNQHEPSARRRDSRVVEIDSAPSKNPESHGDRKRGNSVNGIATKGAWAERRPDATSKPFEGKPELSVPYSRGDGRPDRGRGGKHRGGFYGNHGSNGFQPSGNGSASPIHGPRGSPFQPNSPNAFIPGRNVRYNGSRASSYPSDVYFNSNVPHGFPSSPAPTSPGYYAFPGMPVMSQSGYDPYVQQFALMNGIAHQLNYYFSIDNLLKDMFLREHMDSAGFVPLAFIADFSRMKSLTSELSLIKLVAEQSPEFDVQIDLHGKEVLRKKEGWEKFVLPIDQRKPEAQHDGPVSVDESYGYPDTHGPRRVSENGLPVALGPLFPPPFSPIATGSPVNGFPRSSSNRYSLSAIDSQFSYHQAPPTPFLSAQARSVEPPQDEPDAFPDEKIDHLTVVVRPKPKDSQQPEISRSTSHGSLDGEVLQAKEEEVAEEPPNGTHKRDHSARIADLKKSLTSPTPGHKSQLSTSGNASLFWIKEQGEEPEQLPANSTYEPYGQVCANAFQQRHTAAPGHCPHDMHLLYEFWSHFLLRNFNTRMYTDFKTMAQEDSQQSSPIGLEHLIKYYKDSVLGQRVVRRQVAADFVALAKEEDGQSEGRAFRQLRSAWRNGALMLKNRKIISGLIDAGLQAELDR